MIRRLFVSEDIFQWQLLNMRKIAQLPLFHQMTRSIFFRAVKARKSIIGKISFLRASQSAEIVRLAISRVLSDIFLFLQFYPIILPLKISLKRKTYRDVKGKLIHLLESVLLVPQHDFNKSCKDFLRREGKKWCSNEEANKCQQEKKKRQVV